ncbi:aldehyde reductase [Brachybacterium halotolerans subsp. kimchii]|uniref:SDR family oxidoreductase n=1 Tax=Brachybacterium halotolerans TaxID=2795215 RepID=UPI001E567C2E|nr:aldehyde reductase [Brachybacterium halotolerans]UEJ82834.1 aldehyde reductase [Brachybacterium halotolerans subsp. kimchii]
MPAQRILVTGGSGFIAGHCLLQLLEEGYRVRATMRSLEKEARVRSDLEAAGLTRGEDLEFAAADLTSDDGWARALDGVDAVLHVASPVMPGHVEDEAQLVATAREGTLRVLRAARDAGVQRVVLTSAFHAVSWGHADTGRIFTEEDWTVLDGPGADAYARSKTLAEQAAWEFARSEPDAPELVTMLPVAVMGPLLSTGASGANHVVLSLLQGAIPASPHLFFPIVDVRDVARAHVLALQTPSAAGQRYLLSDGPALEMQEVARILREHLGEAAGKVPSRSLPNAVMRVAGLFSRQMRAIVADLDVAKRASHEKAARELGWEPRPAQDAILDAGRSMISQGLVRP